MITNWLFFSETVGGDKVAGGLLGTVIKGIAGAFTGVGSGAGSGAADTGYFSSSGDFFHDGGIVGLTAPSMVKNVNPAIFSGAKRFHDGLAGDEMPAILQRGETVLPKDFFSKKTEEQPQSGGQPMVININALDSKSFVEMTKQNPQAIVGPIMEAMMSGDQSLRSTMKAVVR
jgi:hypothetical protein